MAAKAISEYLSKMLSPSGNLDDIEMKFLPNFDIENGYLNGLEFNGLYIPEEIMIKIFSTLNPEDVLKCSLVCKNWFNIAKSTTLWKSIYNEREYPKRAKNLPWYVFYSYFVTDNFKNLLKNGNGEKGFQHWKIICNGGDCFCIENPPNGSDPIPPNIPDFNGHTSCFVTSFMECAKFQKIDLHSKGMLRHIIRTYKPTLYASEWYTARFDCACIYKLELGCDTSSNWVSLPRFYHSRTQLPENFKGEERRVEQWLSKPWEKVEIFYNDYPQEVEVIYFIHSGKDLQFWKGHYGSKMAGGVVKFLFDSIEPLPEDQPEHEGE